MSTPHPPAVNNKIDALVAKLRQPVMLENPQVPRFVMMMLSFALHRYLCSVAACLEYWIGRYRDGTLPGRDEDPEDAAVQPRASHSKAKLNPTVRKRRAGAQHVEHLAGRSAEASPEMGGAASEAAAMADMGQLGTSPAWPPRALAQTVCGTRPPHVGLRYLQAGRCRPAGFCRAAERGGKRAPKSFRLVYNMPHHCKEPLGSSQ